MNHGETIVKDLVKKKEIRKRCSGAKKIIAHTLPVMKMSLKNKKNATLFFGNPNKENTN